MTSLLQVGIAFDKFGGYVVEKEDAKDFNTEKLRRFDDDWNELKFQHDFIYLSTLVSTRVFSARNDCCVRLNTPVGL